MELVVLNFVECDDWRKAGAGGKGNLTQRAPSCFPVPAAAAKPRGESNAGAWIPRVPPPTRPVLRPSPIGGSILALARLRWRFLSAPPQLMDMPGPRWKKGKDGKDFAALAAAQPMSSIVAKLQSSLKESKLVATLSSGGGDAVLGVNPQQAALLNRAAFGRALENAGAEKQWFQLGAEEVFYLGHALECIVVESAGKDLMSQGELWDHLCSASESFPEMYKAYSHLRSKNWVVRSGLQYGTDFVAYRHHPALVHSEFAVVVVPEGSGFGGRRGRLKVWSDLLCALRSSGSVAKTLLVLTISSNVCELRSPDCLEQLVVHERTITRWIAQQCREQRCKPCREEAYKEEQDHTGEPLVFNYLGVILGFTVLSSLLVYKLRFRQ